jgi:hypothetical protein
MITARLGSAIGNDIVQESFELAKKHHRNLSHMKAISDTNIDMALLAAII